MKNYVVTITRQFGSMGRDIGRRLAEKLDIAYLDRNLIEKAASEMGVSTSEATQKDIILNYANTQSCVIVGRCSDYVLREYPNALHIYFYAPYKVRIKNSTELLGLSLG